MDISVYLARVFGLYFVIMTVGFLIVPKRMLRMAEEILESTPVYFLSGFIALILGLLVVVGHNVWVLDWRVLITLLGWLMVIQGVLRIFFTETMIQWGRKMMQGNGLAIAMAIFLLIGLFLLYNGF